MTMATFGLDMLVGSLSCSGRQRGRLLGTGVGLSALGWASFYIILAIYAAAVFLDLGHEYPLIKSWCVRCMNGLAHIPRMW
jgi:hypothetical protein